MALPPRSITICTVAAAGIAATVLAALAGWPVERTVELGVVLVAAVLPCLLPCALARNAVSTIVGFIGLLLLGPHPAAFAAALGILSQRLLHPDPSQPLRRAFVDPLTVAATLESAGFVHLGLGGTLRHFAWPFQTLPIAAAIVVVCAVRAAVEDVLEPLLTRRPIRRWDRAVIAHLSVHVIAAGLAVGFVETIDHGAWGVLPAAAIPLYFVYQGFGDYVRRIEDERRRLEVIESLDEGMTVVDQSGRVTLWNEAMGRILGCERERAVGSLVSGAVPALANTAVPRAITEVLQDQKARTLASVSVPLAAGARTLQVKIVPVACGATLLWRDITERSRTEQALKRSEERLALAAEGANDGLWEWDLRTQEFYISGRWKAMVGLPGTAAIGRPEDWMGRVHPDDLVVLKEALAVHLAGGTEHFEHEHRLRHEDGSYRRFSCRGVAARGAGRRPTRIAGSLTDTTERAIADEQLRNAVFVDPLTGLRNRADFVEVLGRRLDEFRVRHASGRFAVLYLDLDRFKVVNDSLGHLVGDELLVAVSRRLESCLRQGDTLARLGGDEFAILLNTIGDELQANAIALRIQEALRQPLLVAGREVFTSASIGIAFGHPRYSNPDEIMRDADTAMYQAKARGKARHELFDADMHARTRDRLGLESDLRRAVDSNDFEVHYQPIVSLASRMCVGFESLVRWRRNGEAVSPAIFVPIAEELGLIDTLGTWVLQEACHAFADWKQRFPNAGLECITVNASSRQLMQPNFLMIVEQAVQQARLRPSDLRIEITETALMDSPQVAAELLRQLRDFGVKIYLDDFGTGYSSLSHLHKLPVDALKIDRSFVKSLLLPDRPATVESILALARTLNTSVVAEGIETDVQARELERLGCTHAQGFYFSRPLAMSSVEALLGAQEPLGPKEIKPEEVRKDEDVYYSSKPFEWPEHMAVSGSQ